MYGRQFQSYARRRIPISDFVNKGLFQEAITFIEKPLTAINIQGAWTWRSKPFSGFIEYSHNGLGLEEVDGSMALPEILSRRLQRRQFFNTGTDYLGAGLSTSMDSALNRIANATSEYPRSKRYRPFQRPMECEQQ